MSRWLMKFEVEAHLGIETEVPVIFKHPTGRYEAHLENYHMEPGCDVPLLNGYFLFEAENLEMADHAGEKHFQGFLDFLAFSTGARFQIRRRVCLFDWNPGIVERNGFVYQDFADPNFPQLALNSAIASTIEALLPSDVDPELMQALHWFAAAVSAGRPDEQFELFWFTIETLARRTRGKEKVPDLCAKCREPLYCHKCQEVSTHRPYPIQAIRQLFAQHVSDDPERAFRVASAMRHALFHGDEVAEVEQEHGLKLSQITDLVGRIAWAGLFSGLVARAGQNKPSHLNLIQPSTFLHHKLRVRVQIGFRSPVGRDPDFTDIPIPKVDIIVQDVPEEATDA